MNKEKPLISFTNLYDKVSKIGYSDKWVDYASMRCLMGYLNWV